MCSVMLGFIFVIGLANVLAAVNGQITCGSRRNFTNGGTYQSNYNSLLFSLYQNVDATGFYSTSVGEQPDIVYGFILCVGDVQLEYCKSNCILNGTSEFARLCPYDTQAIMWSGVCMLGYSDNINFRSPPGTGGWNIWSRINASSPDQFYTDANSLLQNLSGQASFNGTSLRKVAAGSIVTADNQTIYAMVQCVPDISAQACSECLASAALQMDGCCKWQTRVIIRSRGCFIRYERDNLFYNNSRLLELGPVPARGPAVSPPPFPPSPPGPGGRNNRNRFIIPVSISAAGVILIIIVAFLLIRTRTKKAPKKESETSEMSSVESLQYDFERIRAATDGFSEANKLGEGGFGPVYKGKLSDGQEIAVKRLSENSCQGDSEFKNEAMLLVKLQHRNLVRLLGFALHGTERLLVYEYLQNSSLEHYIFDRTKQARLDWDLCYKIIRAISRGIQYLHEDSRLQIIHRDLKPSNVLLDANMNPKIADFGMARLVVQQDVTHVSTLRIVGTYGYMAPEYAIHGQFSTKSDVFSFGVLVLEIVSGRKNSNSGTPGSVGNLLISTVWKNWNGGTPANVINPAFLSNSSIPENILRCIQIGLLCVQENPTERPTMASIVLMLSGDTVTMPVPSSPGYYLPREFFLECLNS